MTMIAETTTVAIGGEAKPPLIPVDVAVRIIAAGIAPQLDAKGKQLRDHDGRPVQLARFTLALTPVKPKRTDGGTVDLADWPVAIGALLSPGSTIQVQVVPVDKDGGRIAPAAGNPSGIKTPPRVSLPLKVRPHPVSDGDLSLYWQRVVGSKKEIDSLISALGTGQPALTQLLRETSGGTAPNIHGSGRSSAAVELSLERAKQILERLSGTSAATRPPVEDNMTNRVRDIAVPLLKATTPQQTDAALVTLSSGARLRSRKRCKILPQQLNA